MRPGAHIEVFSVQVRSSERSQVSARPCILVVGGCCRRARIEAIGDGLDGRTNLKVARERHEELLGRAKLGALDDTL